MGRLKGADWTDDRLTALLASACEPDFTNSCCWSFLSPVVVSLLVFIVSCCRVVAGLVSCCRVVDGLSCPLLSCRCWSFLSPVVVWLLRCSVLPTYPSTPTRHPPLLPQHSRLHPTIRLCSPQFSQPQAPTGTLPNTRLCSLLHPSLLSPTVPPEALPAAATRFHSPNTHLSSPTAISPLLNTHLTSPQHSSHLSLTPTSALPNSHLSCPQYPLLPFPTLPPKALPNTHLSSPRYTDLPSPTLPPNIL